jgi:hypothetical protein
MAEAQAPSTEIRRQGYEPTDANVATVLWVVLAWAVFVGVAAAALGTMIWLFDLLRPPADVPALARTELRPPEPRLEANPKTTLDQVRARENALLNGYAWVDRDAGIARIPIERAIAILAERGWPAAGEPAAGSGR